MLIVRRVPRGGVRLSSALAAVETTTALAIAHTAAGGPSPSVGWLLTVAVMAYGAGTLVLRQRASIRVVLPTLVGAQVLLHAWLVALSSVHGSHVDGGAVLGLSWPMIGAHLVAGAVTTLAWVLRRRAVDVLLSWGDRRPIGPLCPIVAPTCAAAPASSLLLGAAPPRGPPVLVEATA